MLKLVRLSPDSIKITVGESYYDQYIFNCGEMYNYDMKFFYYAKEQKMPYIDEQMTMAKTFYKYQKEIIKFFVLGTGL